MHWPQYLMFGWLVFEAGAAVARHGQPREGAYSGWAAVIVYAFVGWVLYAGGFFGAPSLPPG